MSRLSRHKYAVLLIAAILLIASSGRILTFAAEALVCDQPIQRADAIAIVSGDRRFDFTARAVADGRTQRVLLFEDQFQWAVHVGALPPRHEIALRQLVARDLQTRQITLLAGPTTNRWDRAARLGAWLDKHSESSVLLLCDRFASRKARLALDEVLPVTASERVRIVALADRRFDETNWWKSRIGIKSFVGATLGLIHCYVVGQPHSSKSSSWDPVEYERQLTVEKGAAY